MPAPGEKTMLLQHPGQMGPLRLKNRVEPKAIINDPMFKDAYLGMG